MTASDIDSGKDGQNHKGFSLAKIKKLNFADAKSHVIFWPLVLMGIALDLWTKTTVFNWLSGKPDYSYSVIDGFFRFVMAVNDGAAFGIASGQRHFLVVISLLALAVIPLIFIISGSASRLVHIALALLTAGVCGNLYDRIFNDGCVRDFIDVYVRNYHWPAFNIADSMLCVGVGLIILSGFFTDRPSQKPVRPQK